MNEIIIQSVRTELQTVVKNNYRRSRQIVLLPELSRSIPFIQNVLNTYLHLTVDFLGVMSGLKYLCRYN